MKADRWVKGDNVKGPCRLCGGQLVVRENAKTSNLFVGCRSFPSCRMNRPLRVGDERGTSDPSPATDEARGQTGTMCSVCEEPQFRSPGGVTCAKGHGGAAGIDPATGEVCYPDDEPDPFAKHAGEPGVLVDDPDAMSRRLVATSHSEECKENSEDEREASEHNTVGFPLRIDSFGLVAVMQSFVYKVWLRRREYAGDVLDPTSCDNFREEMTRWLNFHKDRGDIHDFGLSYDESVWPAIDDVFPEKMLYSNRLVLRIKVTKGSAGYYAFDVRLNQPLFECVSSADPTSGHLGVPYNIFDVTFDADHEGTPEHVKEALRGSE